MTRLGLALALAAAVAAGSPRPAGACAIKNNHVAIVLGMIGGEVVTVQFALRENDGATGSAWSGTATLHVGATDLAIGTLDPKRNAGNELDRLIAAARDEATKLAGFVPAVRVSVKDCSDKPGATCDGVVLEHAGSVLRAGSVRTKLGPVGDAGYRALVAVTRYAVGKTAITVANIGSGDPKFATALRTCDGGCHSITTLHHGEQTDVVVVAVTKP